jgi:DNA adenine methylase
MQEPCCVHSDKEIAWAFFVNINQSFSKKLNGGWGRSVCGGNNSSDWESRRKALKETLQRLKSVFIEKTNALDCIKKWDSPQTLFYCDPPYPNANQGHYGGYTIEDFDRLCMTLDSIQGSYVLSNYDQKDIYPKTATRYEIDTYCSASGKGVVKRDHTRKATSEEMGDRKRTEVLWVCDRSGNVREELKSVLAKNSSRLLEVIGEAD